MRVSIGRNAPPSKAYRGGVAAHGYFAIRGCPWRWNGDNVTEARDLGWDKISNGDLLNAAEAAGFDVLLMTDKDIRYQQNLTGRRVSIVVLGNSQWPVVRLHLDVICATLDAAAPGSHAEVDIPFE